MIGVGVARSVRWVLATPPTSESSPTANSRRLGVAASHTVKRHHTRFALADLLLVLGGASDGSLCGVADFGGWRY